MALTWIEGFEDGKDGYGYTYSGNGQGFTTGRGGVGSAWQYSGITGGSNLWIPTRTTSDTVIFGAAVYYGVGANVGQSLQFVSDTRATEHLRFKKHADGHCEVTHAGTSAVIVTTAVNTIPEGSWNYLELKVKMSDTVGEVTVRVNGAVVGTATNVDTKNGGTLAYYDHVHLVWSQGWGQPVIWDDLYIADPTGTYNNDFLGDVVVEHLRPIGNTQSDFLGSDGDNAANYLHIDESGGVTTADYVQASDIGAREIYALQTATRALTSVKGLMTIGVAERTDTSTATTLKVLTQDSTGTQLGSAVTPPVGSQVPVTAIVERKASGAAWGPSDLASLKIGAEVG